MKSRGLLFVGAVALAHALSLALPLSAAPLAVSATQGIESDLPGPNDFSAVYRFHKYRSEQNGALPLGGLLAMPDGSLIGTTSSGGQHDAGSVFRVDPGGNETVLHSFDPAADGTSVTRAPTLAADGRVYGVATLKGPMGGGTIWRIDADGSNFTVLHAFSCCDGPREPFSNIAHSGGRVIYGTARAGAKGNGAVWKLTLTTGKVAIVHRFAADGHEGGEPNALVSDGKHLYGTAQRGGTRDEGTAYRLDLGSNRFRYLGSFGSLVGGQPVGNIAFAGRNVYGMTTEGLFYKLRKGKYLKGIRVLRPGLVPTGLMSTSPHRFYGTAIFPGEKGSVLFAMNGGGHVRYLHTFDDFKDGLKPSADSLTLGKDGYLYGTCLHGGRRSGKFELGMGTVFRIAPLRR